MQVLNFYSTIFADQLKRGRKTATIRLGDKSHKYRKNQAVLVTIGYQHSPREKIFEAVIDQVEVKRVKDLSPRDIEHDNPEFRRHEEMHPLPRADLRQEVAVDDIVTVVRFTQIIENPPGRRTWSKRTVSPALTSSGMRFAPSSSNRPSPTASTSPRCGFSFAVSGRTRPLAVVSSSSIARTIRRSPRGFSFNAMVR